MNILFTTHTFPWPAASGASIRAAETIRALAALGSVDVVCVVDPARAESLEAPPDTPADRVAVLGRPARLVRGRGGRMRWLVASNLPQKLARDYSTLRDAYAAWARVRYDVAWLGGAEGFTAFADLVDAPVVCNLDDLEDRKLARRVAIRSAADLAGVRRVWARGRDRVEAARWARLHRTIAGRSARVVVCSDLEAHALRAGAVGNVAVVPNVYPEPAHAAGREAAGRPPTVLFAGLLTYEPNIDAARFLVTDVLPRLRRHHPDAEVRLVGTYDRRVTDLAGRRGVTLAGGVPDMTPELARADVAAVPIRFGGGTRVKILEAFAHGIPVVSTLAGAEGLDVIAGEHLVIADDAQAFADACARALDGDVRHGLRAAGRQLWYDRYRPAALSASVAEVVQDAWADSTPPPSHG